MYYPCSENKDADQLRGYREADLRLCFRPCKLLVFSRTCSIKLSFSFSVFFLLFFLVYVYFKESTRIRTVDIQNANISLG